MSRDQTAEPIPSGVGADHDTDHAPDRSAPDRTSANPGEDTTVTEILSGYAAAGYDTEMSVTGASMVRCHACGVEHRPRDLQLDSVRRMEGASDPDDLQAVVALVCVCGARGALVLGYGPASSEEDADVFAGLDDRRENSDIPSSQPPADDPAAP